jgi:hypothetical protein
LVERDKTITICLSNISRDTRQRTITFDAADYYAYVKQLLISAREKVWGEIESVHYQRNCSTSGRNFQP